MNNSIQKDKKKSHLSEDDSKDSSCIPICSITGAGYSAKQALLDQLAQQRTDSRIHTEDPEDSIDISEGFKQYHSAQRSVE